MNSHIYDKNYSTGELLVKNELANTVN